MLNYLSEISIYKFRFHLQVTDTYIFPEFQGTALRVLFTGLRRKDSELCNFFFETEGKHLQTKPFIICPFNFDKRIYYVGEFLIFDLIIFGSNIQYFNNIVPFFELDGRPVLSKKKIFRFAYLQNIVSSHEAVNIDDFRSALPFRFSDLQVTNQHKKLIVRFLTPVCIANCQQPQDYSFERIVENIIERITLIHSNFSDSEIFTSFSPFLHSAKNIVTKKNRLFPVKVRHFTRNEVVYNAFIGELFFEGNFSIFNEIFQLAEIIQIGRGTTSALGKLQFLWND